MTIRPVPKSILITGATGAIGAALAQAYAAPGQTLVLHGRNLARLEEVAASCRAAGAHVLTQDIDLRETQLVLGWVEAMCEEHALDLVIANAGMNIDNGPDDAGEEWEEMEALIDTNIKAAIATVKAAVPFMRARGSGQLVLISSLAGFYGLPVTPTYSASKAAVKANGEAMRGWLEPYGVSVNVVMPGYVSSPMCHDMPGPKPFLWQPERAAAVIQRGLLRDKPRITFPFPLDYGCWWLAVLPPSWSQRILRWLDYGN